MAEEEHNENFIRNLADDYKEILEEKDNKYQNLVRKHNNLFKIMCVMYSTFRQLDIAFSRSSSVCRNLFFLLTIHSRNGYSQSQYDICVFGYLAYYLL